MKSILLLALVLLVTVSQAQKKTVLEVSRDAFGFIEFEPGSTNMTLSGRAAFNKLKAYTSKNSPSIILYALSKGSEINQDEFIGYYRVLLTLDSLTASWSKGMSSIKISKEEIQENDSGIKFIIESEEVKYAATEKRRKNSNSKNISRKPVKLNFSEFAFSESSAKPTDSEIQNLKNYIAAHANKYYELNLFPNEVFSTKTEVRQLQIKRCKAVIESLASTKNIDRIFIKCDYVNKQNLTDKLKFQLTTLPIAVTNDEFFNE